MFQVPLLVLILVLVLVPAFVPFFVPIFVLTNSTSCPCSLLFYLLVTPIIFIIIMIMMEFEELLLLYLQLSQHPLIYPIIIPSLPPIYILLCAVSLLSFNIFHFLIKLHQPLHTVLYLITSRFHKYTVRRYIYMSNFSQFITR